MMMMTKFKFIYLQNPTNITKLRTCVTIKRYIKWIADVNELT